MFEIAIVTALLVIAVVFALVSSRAIDRADSRDDVARHLFLAAFDGSGAPTELLVHTFEALRPRVPQHVDVMRPADHLVSLYGFTQEDAEDVALLVAARMQGDLPTVTDLDRFDEQVRTVADLVRYLIPFTTRREQAAHPQLIAQSA